MTRRDRALAVVAILLIAGFVLAFGARPAIVLSTARHDDALFIQLGQSLAAGQWLGPYDDRTLAKGMGFPLFLALANLLGLAFPLAIALFHAACSAFAAAVVGRLTRSPVTALASLAAFLLAPSLYEGELMRVFRDLFYASATLAFVAAAIALVTGRLGTRRRLVALTGALGALVWLTREEGVWLIPAVVVLAFAPLAADGPWRGRWRALVPAGQALGVAVGLVVAVGVVNWAAYGRFEVNEVKSADFQGALRALQDAAAPERTMSGVPVPAAARARIYAVSPAFASLREPLLDGPLKAQATQAGCAQRPETCGDFGGGWFLWTLRSSAAIHGQHTSPGKAAGFYRTLAREVRGACDEGRLTCGRWRVPMVPPMHSGDLGRVARSFAAVLDVTTFGQPVSTTVAASDLSAPGAEAQVAFLNRPATVQARTPRRLVGWFVATGDQWFEVLPGAGVEVVSFSREDSPDLVGALGDPGFARQRFTLEAVCPSGACPVSVRSGGQAFVQDLAALRVGTHRLGGARLHVDQAGGGEGAALIKTRLSNAWVGLASRLNPLFRGLVAVGVAAYLGLLALAVARRRVSAPLIVCTALFAAVLARSVILALIDALAFTAAHPVYALAGVPLLLLASLLALHEALAELRARRSAA